MLNANIVPTSKLYAFTNMSRRVIYVIKICRKYLISGKSNGGTGNLRRHLIKNHSDKFSHESLEQDQPFVSFKLKVKLFCNDTDNNFAHRFSPKTTFVKHSRSGL